jgi:Flp pilus assembly protein TadD
MSRRRTIGSLFVTASILVAGCGEYVTYSKQSRARGVEYLETNQREEAKGAFRDAVRQNPRDYESYYYLGQIYAQENAFAQAITNYRTSLSVQNVTAVGRSDVAQKMKTIDAMALALAKFDTRDSEINRIEQAAASSTSGDEYLVLAKAFAARGDADSAIDAFARSANQAPTSFYVAKQQGLYLEQVGHKPLAEAALRRAYRLDDNDAEVNTALRRLGIIPGPALKNENELVRPPLPSGPIPDLITPSRDPVPAPRPAPTPNPAD